MRILLVAPPFYRLFRHSAAYFPLGLGYVAASLREAGHLVRILHADYDPECTARPYQEMMADFPLFQQGLHQQYLPCWDEISGAVRDFRPDVVGSSAMSVYLESAWKVLEIAKNALPQVVTVLGGPAVTANPDAAMLNLRVDFSVSGEGEVAAVKLVDALEGGDRSDLHSIAGLSWRGQKGAACRNERGPWVDVNTVGLPARDLLSFKEYPPDLYGTMVTARGCPYRCAFCNSPAMWGSRMRYRSVAEVIKEIQSTKDRFGTKYFHIFDDVFTVNKRRTQRLLQLMIERALGIRYWCNTRLDLLDEELLTLLAESGCHNLSIGIESGSDRILRSIKKDISRSTMEEKLRILEGSGVAWSAFFMIGFPEERVEDLELTLDLMQQVRPPLGIIFSIFTPYEGTPLYDECEHLGLTPKAVDEWSRFSHQSPENYFAPNVPREVFADYVKRAADIADRSRVPADHSATSSSGEREPPRSRLEDRISDTGTDGGEGTPRGI